MSRLGNFAGYRGSASKLMVLAALFCGFTFSAAGQNVQHIVDFNGDGKTDFSVGRASGAAAQVTWFQGINGSPIYTAQPWGIGLDTLIPADFDGDNKTDFTVWRPGSQAFFYILRSTDNTVNSVPFGINGDD